MSDNEYRSVTLRDGRKLSYAEYGDPKGLPVIRCHSMMSSRLEGRGADEVAADLGVRVIVPDRPGMGGSDFQHGRALIDWPDDVANLTTSLGIDTFSVLGTSGGGAYALACAAHLAARVRAVSLVSSVAPYDVAGHFAAMTTRARNLYRIARMFPWLSRLQMGVAVHGLKGRGQFWVDTMIGGFPEPDRSLLRRPEFLERFITFFTESFRRGTRGPVWDLRIVGSPWGFDLTGVKAPTQLWHGDCDPNCPRLFSEFLVGNIANCRATYFPTEGHFTLAFNQQRRILSALVQMAA